MTKPIVNQNENIRDLMKQIKNKDLVIPAFQRPFVWNTTQIKDLISSILQGYYVGIALSWKVDFKNIPLKAQPFYGIEGDIDSTKNFAIILDGQQRLSSLYYAIFAPNKPLYNTTRPYLFFLDLENLEKGEIDDAILVYDVETGIRKYSDTLNCYREEVFPLTAIKEYEEWLLNYADFLEDKKGLNKQQAREKMKNIKLYLHKLWETEGALQIIELPTEYSLKQICDIFIRINDTGTALTVFDLLNAKLLVHKVELSEMWTNVIKEDTQYKLIKEFSQGNPKFPVLILQAIALLRAENKNNTWIVNNKNKDLVELSYKKFEDDWNKAIIYIEKALKHITTCKNSNLSFGVIKKDYLPYQPMIPILAIFLLKLDELPQENYKKNAKKISAWYWSSIFTNAYTSSTDSQMAKDYREVLAWFEDENLTPSVIKEMKVKIDAFNIEDVNSKSNSIYKGIICLTALKGAEDFINGKIAEHNTLDDHHIFPQSKHSHFKTSQDEINSILNITLLSLDSNRIKIKNRSPSDYFKEIKEKIYDNDEKKLRESLKTHFINSEAYDSLLKDDFKSFIKYRKEELKNELIKLIGLESISVTLNNTIRPENTYTNILLIKDVIKNCKRYLYWIDPYFNENSLELLAKSLDKEEVKDIKIITGISQYINLDFKNSFKKFREEMKNYDINSELKVIIEHNIKNKIHDRYILTKNKTVLVPSTDTVQRGQLSSIVELDTEIDFEYFWKEGKDLINDWNDIEKNYYEFIEKHSTIFKENNIWEKEGKKWHFEFRSSNIIVSQLQEAIEILSKIEGLSGPYYEQEFYISFKKDKRNKIGINTHKKMFWLWFILSSDEIEKIDIDQFKDELGMEVKKWDKWTIAIQFDNYSVFTPKLKNKIKELVNK